jgi:outer membrane biosynthesis protein TonB
MRASRTGVIATLALLAVAPIPLATAISAAAVPAAPSVLGVDLDETVDDTVQSGTGTVGDVLDEVIPTKPSEPEPEPQLPEPEPEPVPVPKPSLPKPQPEPEPAKPTSPQTPRPPITLTPTPVPVPAPAPKPSEHQAPDSGAHSGSGSAPATKPRSGSGGTSGGAAGAPWRAGGAGASGGTGIGPTLLGDALGPQFASSNPNASSISYSGAAPLLPESNAGDPNVRSLLIAGGQRNDAISPVAEDNAGSVTGLLVLGTLASLMLYGSAAYLKFGKRRPVAGRHKA